MRPALFVLTVLMLCGCRPESSEPIVAPRPPSPPPSQRSAVDSIVVPLPSDEIDVDPAGTEWQTEQYSQAIDRHLKHLAECIANGVYDESKLSFIDESVEHTSLRPIDTKLVYKGTALEVRRWMRETTVPIRVDGHHGKTSLITEFESIAESANGKADSQNQTYVKFKIVGVSPVEQQLRTDVLWQLSSPSPEGNYQQNARWECRWDLSDESPRLVSVSLAEFQEVQASEQRQFFDCTAAVTRDDPQLAKQFGPSIDHWLDRLEYRFGILPSSYQGIAIADVNGDGLEDVFIAQPGGVSGGLPNRLLVQQADGTVIDRSAESGLDWLIETHSALFVDLDNDGDQDIVVATVMGLVFAANDGHGRFQKRAVKITPEAPPMSLAAADFDNDRDLDIYVCCYSPRTSSPLMGRPLPYHDANNGGRNLLLRNDRDWRFRDATRQVGMDTNNRRFSFAAAWEDYDNDNDMDLYVANDYGRNNLFRNDGGYFTDVAADLGLEDISAGMSVAWGDYNRDGWMDLYISNMWSSAGKRIAYQRQFQPGADSATRSHLQRHARGNSLFMNRLGDSSTFSDVSLTEGVTMGRWAWSSQFADINNNGYLDIVVANGFITQEDSGDL